MAHPKVSFSEKDYLTIKLLVESGDFADLKPLLRKMETARKPKPEYDFTDPQARIIANEVLGDKVYFTTITSGELVKHNKYFRTYKMSPETFTKACKVADKSWKPPIYFNYLVMNSNRLAATPLFADQPKDVFGGG